MLSQQYTQIARRHWKDFLIFGLFCVTLLFLFYPALQRTWESWQQEEYSHGYLVPLIGIVLLANKVLHSPPQKANSWLGFAAILTCIILEFLFSFSGIQGLQPLLLVCFMISFFLLLYGLRFTLFVAGPLAFFFFLAPLPKFLYYTISFKMQMLSTSISRSLFELAGFSVFQDGNIIDLGIIQLEVVEACNGLRYLFPLLALGYLLVYMYKTSFIKRAILFLSIIPVTIFMNSVRIFIVGLSANLWGAEIAEGLVHDAQGWIVFLGCLLILAGEITLMQKFSKKEVFDFDVISLPSRKAACVFFPVPWQKPVKASIILFLVALGLQTALISSNFAQIHPVYLEKPLSEFPMEIGQWRGTRSTMDQASLDVLGTDEYLLADYVNTAGELVNLYMLYFPKQDSTSNQAVHTPEVCIPGGGWKIVSHTTTVINSRPVNRLIIAKGLQKQLVYYWFFQGDEVTVDAAGSRLSIIKRAVFERRTDGGMVRLLTPITDGEDKAEKVLEDFWGEDVKPFL